MSTGPEIEKKYFSVSRERDRCIVCGRAGLTEVLPLPALPLTGIFLQPGEDRSRYPNFDQALLFCDECGHGQLRFFIDPKVVYGSIYTHRSSRSPIAAGGNDFFAAFVGQVAAGRNFNRVVDIGCNDLYLLGKFRGRAAELIGIDPIWRGKAPPESGGARVIGKFAEEVDFEREAGGADLVLSAHTFEHVDSPLAPLARALAAAAPGALFVIEVPSLDTLLANLRFDQVFHQHVNYFSLASMSRLIRELGGEYLAHTYNYGYWGGTMLVAFRKPAGRPAPPPEFNRPARESIAESYARFREQMDLVRRALLAARHETIYGYGAAQMLPTLAYHLRSDLSFLAGLLDDDPARGGLTYPTLPIIIRNPADDFSLANSTALLTALDSARPILRRLIALGARRIILPLPIL
ncbi:methyltransferase domain-containing protein [Patescibacteria group bacterium]|nr:MAG: methyltransferase domain-containing protein [Patescibacteria group bacterium]